MNKDNFLVEIFTKVVKHLLAQKKKAAKRTNTKKCYYRLGNLKCAAGCLIPDSDYTPEMENKPAWKVNFFKFSGYSKKEIDLISDLQIVHDRCDVKNWKKELNSVSKKYNLNIDVRKL